MSRLAVVCGGSRGIGEAVARLLAERGRRVAVVSRNQEAAEAAVAALHGGAVIREHVKNFAFICEGGKDAVAVSA
uniref:Uncharacterized protein n=1 Tax=Xiphophorus couchianus TaxID=32473 RepID=A0A3B5LGZ1_9TELE